MAIDYRKGGDKVRKAWFAYEKDAFTLSTKSVSSFVAGWNAAEAEPKVGASIGRALIRLISQKLSDDLLSPKWRKLRDETNGLSGHCYVAAEALWHLLGGMESGYVPHVLTHTLWPESLNPGETHWYLAKGKSILDPTAGQFKIPVAYDKGRANGFLTNTPSRRARILILRVRKST